MSLKKNGERMGHLASEVLLGISYLLCGTRPGNSRLSRGRKNILVYAEEVFRVVLLFDCGQAFVVVTE